MNHLPETIIFKIFENLDEEYLFRITDKYQIIATQVLYKKLKCWGCVYNCGNQEAHYNGCLSDPQDSN